MPIKLALVLAYDLSPDGQALGLGTILRLQRGLEHAHATGETLVVAASYSPNHPLQYTPMATMMAVWLRQRGWSEVLVLRATEFNTRGEIEVFMQLEGAHTIISAPWHLERTKILLRKLYGQAVVEQLTFVPVERDLLSARGRRLEFCKRHFLYLVPLRWQESVRKAIVQLAVKQGKNLSY